MQQHFLFSSVCSMSSLSHSRASGKCWTNAVCICQRLKNFELNLVYIDNPLSAQQITIHDQSRGWLPNEYCVPTNSKWLLTKTSAIPANYDRPMARASSVKSENSPLIADLRCEASLNPWTCLKTKKYSMNNSVGKWRGRRWVRTIRKQQRRMRIEGTGMWEMGSKCSLVLDWNLFRGSNAI